MKYRFAVSVAALAVLAGSTVGCGGGNKEVRAPLRGTVTYQGKPVTMGRVNFDSAAQGVYLTAALGPTGTFEVRTNREAGLPPGTYQVAVFPPAENPNDKYAPPPECPNIPLRYRNPATSGLTCTVVEGQDNQYDIDMKGR